MSFFRIAFTTPFYGGDDPSLGFEPAQFLGWLKGFKKCQVAVANPRAGSRTASFKVSIWDETLQRIANDWGIAAYEIYAYILYGHIHPPVFWGPIGTPEWNSEEETVVFNCIDHGPRMQAHQFQRGDDPLVGNKGQIVVGPTGLLDCVKAARNTPAEDTRGTPPLGVNFRPLDSEDSDVTFEVTRGTEVWQTCLDIQENTQGPEFQFFPREFDPDQPFYYNFDSTQDIGTDRSNQIIFQDGLGVKNIKQTLWKPGGKIITNAHILDSGGWAVAVSDTSASSRAGVWSMWEVTDFKVPHTPKGRKFLAARGHQYLKAYSRPPNYADLTLKRGSELDNPSHHYRFRYDFHLGDVVRVEVWKGAMQTDFNARIEEVRMIQQDDTGEAWEEITVVPYFFSTDYSVGED